MSVSSSASTTVDVLFKEHSFEEIESVRDNLASEIDKRTELLKSIVKEKYRDVVETSDAIQSMKLNLKNVEQSIESLDKNIFDFHQRLNLSSLNGEGTIVEKKTISSVQSSKTLTTLSGKGQEIGEENLIKKLFDLTDNIWTNFDSGNLKASIKLHNEAMKIIEKYHKNVSEPAIDDKEHQVILRLESSLQRAIEVMRQQLWYKISSAAPNQIGIIDSGASDDDNDGYNELFRICMSSSIEHLVDSLKRNISDTNLSAQIKRYQPYAYYNTKTNQLDADIDDFKQPTELGCHVQIPKYVSIELSSFLFDTSRVINTIAGFSLTNASTVYSLKVTVEKIIEVYSGLLSSVSSDLKGESKRRRAMQFYFDLMYVRVLLNTSIDIELIEELDPEISNLAGRFEPLLDSIELYMVSDAMHTNVLQLSKATVRLYGLLIPNLQ